MGVNVLDPEVEMTHPSRRGMVFQRPNLLPLSIRDNALFAYRLHRGGGLRAEEEQVVEQALTEVLLWDQVKDRLNQNATELPRGAAEAVHRASAPRQAQVLMDEPCSGPRPRAPSRSPWRLRGDYSILIVTHNMAQARRASDECIFMLMGKVVEHSATTKMFVTPEQKETADYLEAGSADHLAGAAAPFERNVQRRPHAGGPGTGPPGKRPVVRASRRRIRG